MRKAHLLILVFILLFAISGTVSADVVVDWNNTAIGALKTGLYTSVKASRTLAMVHVAMYDAVNSIEQTHEPFYVWLSAPDGDISTDAAAATAAYGVLAGLFPEQIATLDAALANSLAVIPDGDAKTMGMQLGEIVANGVLLIREKDGSDAMVPYTPGTEPGDWRPTPPGYLPAMMPHWADVTPFAMEDGSQFRKTSPPPLGSRSYANAVNQVKTIGAKNSSVRTMEQTTIANFWADMPGTETTVGRWNLVAQDVAVAAGNTLSENARLFALLNVSLADAGIAAWDFKYHFNFWRPITAIQEADTDGNRFTEPDPTWEPLLMTPAFPEYVSAHSTFSAAAAQMLASYFGRNNVTFTIDPYMMMGMPMDPRTFTSFSDAALEAGASRIYGGIHYLFSNGDGLNAGRSISQYVWHNFMRPVR